MTMKFRTKEESNREQEIEFLALTPHERVVRFFELVRQVKRFRSVNQNEKNDNFIIQLNRE